MAYYEIAREVFSQESEELAKVADRLDEKFDQLVNLVGRTSGRIVFVGIGKSQIIAEKISASLSSVSIHSFTVDAGTAYHGDLGRISSDDLLIFVSNSGETQEVLQTLFSLQLIFPEGLKTVSLTGNLKSTLATNTDLSFDVGVAKEADTTGLAPTSSTTATLVFGDALLVALENRQDFTRNKFALYHPGGTIGRLLLQRVKQAMHSKVPYVDEDTPINEVIYQISDFGIGMTLVKDKITGKAIGIVTDGDIRKKFLSVNSVKKSVASDYMTKGFISINQDKRNKAAWQLMANYGISNLVVVDDDENVVGVATVHDVL
ncbi:KpsF/GutQ family sugar-phosphate isomerase [Oenococcus kitaharae]|uniref:KpsF/GutQ family sugar-phosphate isomerase n=1 Tax=Oenococcus TaxID=46254 RepID=UPI0021E6FB99|nr:KpsF/GutQ family sugar-phosphate isomerase [Oenococcus kitaharae]MCV3296158.1 KpsF/GutQ family sugar-phosphate isomerase [Oenococcus kitaharae]